MADTPTVGRDWLSVAKHILTVLALLALALLVFKSSVSFSSAMVSSAFGDLIPKERKDICDKPAGAVADQKTAEGTSAAKQSVRPDAIEIVKPILPNLATYPASDAERQRIADQALKAQRLECLHMTVFDMYARNYYGAIVTSMVFGGIAAIALFLVGPKGWSASSPYLVNVLVTSAAITAFYGAFPGVFQQASLVTAHKAQILRYEALLDGMASHTAAQAIVPALCKAQRTSAPTPPPFLPADFIACTDDALANADIAFGFDPKSQPDYQKALGRSAGN